MKRFKSLLTENTYSEAEAMLEMIRDATSKDLANPRYKTLFKDIKRWLSELERYVNGPSVQMSPKEVKQIIKDLTPETRLRFETPYSVICEDLGYGILPSSKNKSLIVIKWNPDSNQREVVKEISDKADIVKVLRKLVDVLNQNDNINKAHVREFVNQIYIRLGIKL